MKNKKYIKIIFFYFIKYIFIKNNLKVKKIINFRKNQVTYKIQLERQTIFFLPHLLPFHSSVEIERGPNGGIHNLQLSSQRSSRCSLFYQMSRQLDNFS
jgi:hypothetical protein